MKKIECWRLNSINDTGPYSLVARFASREEAEAAKDLAGGYGPHIEREEIVIYDTAIELRPQLDKAARNSGLAKLTERERAALGL